MLCFYKLQWAVVQRPRPRHAPPKKFKNDVFTLKNSSNVFRPHLRRRNLKTQQSLAILDFCLGKTRPGKSHDYSDVIVFEKLRFRDGLVRTVGLTAKMKLRYQIYSACCDCCGRCVILCSASTSVPTASYISLLSSLLRLPTRRRNTPTVYCILSTKS